MITFFDNNNKRNSFKRSIKDIVTAFYKSNYANKPFPLDRSLIAFISSNEYEAGTRFEPLTQKQWQLINQELEKQQPGI